MTNLGTNDTSPSIPASTNEPPAQKPTEKTPSAENHEGAPQDAILYTHRKKMNYQPSCDCAADEPVTNRDACVTCHTRHTSVTDFRPKSGNPVEVTLVTSPKLYIVSHAKGTDFP